MKSAKMVALVCVVIIVIALLNLKAMPNLVPKAHADSTAGQIVWGDILVIEKYSIVSNDHEIDRGHFGYVFNKQSSTETSIKDMDWYKLRSGNVAAIVEQIERDIPGSKVTWIRISWEKAEYYEPPQNPDMPTKAFFKVSGFMVEAIVENINAGLTGSEIFWIIMAISFIIAVSVLLAVATWIVWEVINAIKQLPDEFEPWVMIIVGLLILCGIGFLLFVLFGGRVAYSGKKRKVEVGKNSIFPLNEGYNT